MADVVLGLATSHGPQLRLPPSEWHLLAEKDVVDPRMDYPALLAQASPRLVEENTPEKWQQRYDACHAALRVLKQKLDDAKPDAIVLVGDDQHEQFHENNLPMFSIFYGDSFTITKRRVRENAPAYTKVEAGIWPLAPMDVPASPDLARHLIESLRQQDFDIASSNELDPNVGLGHAFNFIYRFIHPEGTIPMVPVMVNTFFPPNQPTPRRCYTLGRALRSALEDWDPDRRVALIGSGGMSHTVIDEDLDREVLDALVEKDRERLCSLPEEKLTHGTSEILNLVVVAGAMEPEPMTLLDYIPAYRTPAGTGHADAFTYWE